MKDTKTVKKSLCVVSNLPTGMKRTMVKEAFTGGQFVTVEWVTKSGKISKMNCRLGVTKHLRSGKKLANGSSNSVAHIKKYLTVYKVNAGNKNGYRNLNLDTVLSLRYKGNKIHFSG